MATLPVNSLISLLPWLRQRFDVSTSIEVIGRNFKRRSVITLDFGEAVQVGAQHVATKAYVHELAFANDVDQAGRFQLLDVMRKGRGAHLMGPVQDAAGGRVGASADLLEDPIASRFGQGPGDSPERLVG